MEPGFYFDVHLVLEAGIAYRWWHGDIQHAFYAAMAAGGADSPSLATTYRSLTAYDDTRRLRKMGIFTHIRDDGDVAWLRDPFSRVS